MPKRKNECYQRRLEKFIKKRRAKTEREELAREFGQWNVELVQPTRPTWRLIPIDFDLPKPPVYISPADPRSRRPITIPLDTNINTIWNQSSESNQPTISNKTEKEDDSIPTDSPVSPAISEEPKTPETPKWDYGDG